MNLDWKEISQSEGYKSLKATYEHDVQDAHKDVQRGQRPMRNKEYFRKLFNWVISRAIHYAYHQNKTVSDVLNEWESKRNYCWLNYYQESRQPKLNKSPTLRWKSVKTQYKEDIHRIRNATDKNQRIKSIKERYVNNIIHVQQEQSKRKGNKKRWSEYKRKNVARYRLLKSSP